VSVGWVHLLTELQILYRVLMPTEDLGVQRQLSHHIHRSQHPLSVSFEELAAPSNEDGVSSEDAAVHL